MNLAERINDVGVVPASGPPTDVLDTLNVVSFGTVDKGADP